MGDASDFAARLDELADMVGRGHLIGKVEVDQVYAQAQHNSTWVSGPLAGHVIRRHPGGGGGLYLSAPLEDHRGDYMQHLADHTLSSDRLAGAMVDNVEDLSSEVARLAPDEFGDLRRSAHPTVTDDGADFYDRPAAVSRLTRGELDDKRRGVVDRERVRGRDQGLMVRRTNAELPGGDPGRLANRVRASRVSHRRRIARLRRLEVAQQAEKIEGL